MKYLYCDILRTFLKTKNGLKGYLESRYRMQDRSENSRQKPECDVFKTEYSSKRLCGIVSSKNEVQTATLL